MVQIRSCRFRRQAILWINVVRWVLGNKLNEVWIKIRWFSFQENAVKNVVSKSSAIFFSQCHHIRLCCMMILCLSVVGILRGAFLLLACRNYIPSQWNGGHGIPHSIWYRVQLLHICMYMFTYIYIYNVIKCHRLANILASYIMRGFTCVEHIWWKI